MTTSLIFDIKKTFAHRKTDTEGRPIGFMTVRGSHSEDQTRNYFL